MLLLSSQPAQSCSSLTYKAALHLQVVSIKAERLTFPVGHVVGAGLLRRQSLRSIEVRAGVVAAAQQPAHVLPERSREDGVQERVAEGVDGVEQDEQDLGVGHRYERHPQGGGDGEEGDGRYAQEVREDEHGHALGDLRVSMAGGVLGVVNAEVHAHVTVAHHQERHNVEDEHGHHVNLRAQGVDIHGQADAHFAVTADPH